MSETKIANRYASALFQQALSDNNLSLVAENMKMIATTCSNSKDLMNVLSNPIIKASEKLSALKMIFANTTQSVTNFIELVCSKNRESLINEIADAFLVIYRKHLGIEKVEVVSAIALDSNTQESIKLFVKEKTGSKEIELNSSIQPDLIGGMQIRFGDNLLDTSISAKLRKLKKELNIA